MFNKELIRYNDLLLIVKRKVRESHLKPDADMGILKQWAGADLVLRKEGILYLCETIPDAKIIE